MYVILRDLQWDIASRLRIVFRHYPLSGVHHHAQQTAEAAEAAGILGKFCFLPVGPALEEHPMAAAIGRAPTLFDRVA